MIINDSTLTNDILDNINAWKNSIKILQKLLSTYVTTYDPLPNFYEMCVYVTHKLETKSPKNNKQQYFLGNLQTSCEHCNLHYLCTSTY